MIICLISCTTKFKNIGVYIIFFICCEIIKEEVVRKSSSTKMFTLNF